MTMLMSLGTSLSNAVTRILINSRAHTQYIYSVLFFTSFSSLLFFPLFHTAQL